MAQCPSQVLLTAGGEHQGEGLNPKPRALVLALLMAEEGELQTVAQASEMVLCQSIAAALEHSLMCLGVPCIKAGIKREQGIHSCSCQAIRWVASLSESMKVIPVRYLVSIGASVLKLIPAPILESFANLARASI